MVTSLPQLLYYVNQVYAAGLRDCFTLVKSLAMSNSAMPISSSAKREKRGLDIESCSLWASGEAGMHIDTYTPYR